MRKFKQASGILVQLGLFLLFVISLILIFKTLPNNNPSIGAQIGTQVPYPYAANTAVDSSVPTPTGIPIIPPAEDARGTIYYFSSISAEEMVLEAVEVDAYGMPLGGSQRKSDKGIRAANLIFPDSEGKYAAINYSFRMDLLDLETGKYLPLNDPIRKVFYDWYPDGHQILVQYDTALYLYDPISDNTRLIYEPNYGDVGGGAVSPDGRKVVFSYRKGFNDPTQIWISDINGRNAALIDDGSSGDSFAWSPDGTTIAFYGAGLMTMNADGGNLQSISRHVAPLGYLIPPKWSPDSRLIAIVCLKDRPEEAGGTSDEDSYGSMPDRYTIHIIDVLAREEFSLDQLVQDGALDPAWSPDGRLLAFTLSKDGSNQIWVYDLQPQEVYPLVEDGSSRYPMWVRSGQSN